MTTMRIPHCRALRPVQRRLCVNRAPVTRSSLRSLATTASTIEENSSKAQEADTPTSDKDTSVASKATTATITTATSDVTSQATGSNKKAATATDSSESLKEDIYTKFNLKPSAEVGIRARVRAKRVQQQIDNDHHPEAQSKAAKIHRLFEKLQLGKPADGRQGSTAKGLVSASASSDATATSKEGSVETKKKISESWKFLFDEGDLADAKKKHKDLKEKHSSTSMEGKEENAPEILDTIPGASTLFPAISEHRSSSSSSSSSSSPITDSSRTSGAATDRWKDPKLGSSEKEAFKALFSSLFEKKSSSKDRTTSPAKVQTLFSNFNRSGLEETADNSDGVKDTFFESTTFPDASPTDSNTTTLPPQDEDPMQLLRRQVENLSKRVDPIYLDYKPKTSSFQVMESTVGPQDWMNKEATLPQQNSLFALIREENKVAIRMRKELESKANDILKVKEFVDELIFPFTEKGTLLSKSSQDVKPSVMSLDGLLAEAILAASSTRSGVSGFSGKESSSSASSSFSSASSNSYVPPDRSLHPYLGHALVEHTRRQGLQVFIRTVRTESYKALLKSRWDNWRDGPGCLEVLKEMQRNGALLDQDTKSIIRSMVKELKATSTLAKPLSTLEGPEGGEASPWVQHGWGEEEQAAPLLEMLNILESAEEDREQTDEFSKWSRRADATDASYHTPSSRRPKKNTRNSSYAQR